MSRCRVGMCGFVCVCGGGGGGNILNCWTINPPLASNYSAFRPLSFVAPCCLKRSRAYAHSRAPNRYAAKPAKHSTVATGDRSTHLGPLHSWAKHSKRIHATATGDPRTISLSAAATYLIINGSRYSKRYSLVFAIQTMHPRLRFSSLRNKNRRNDRKNTQRQAGTRCIDGSAAVSMDGTCLFVAAPCGCCPLQSHDLWLFFYYYQLLL